MSADNTVRLGRSRHGRTVAVLVVLGLVAGAAAYWFVLRPDPNSASRVALPAAPTGTAAARLSAYLHGPGAALPKFVSAVPADLRSASQQRCAALTVGLDRVGSPRTLQIQAGRVPDPTIQASALNALSAVTQFIGSCRAGRPDPATQQQAQFQVEVLRRLLARAGGAA